MGDESLQVIEQEIALLVRLTTSYSPRLGDLDRSEYVILSALDQHSPMAINNLAETLKLNLSTASRQVASMAAKKLIHRYPDPQNGRISLVDITNEGQKILERVQKARYDVYAEVLQEWSSEELKILETNLSRLNKDFKKWRK